MSKGVPKWPTSRSQKTFTAEDFQRRVIEASADNLLILVHCFAPWAAPCRTMQFVLDEIAAEKAYEALIIGELNLDPGEADEPKNPILTVFQLDNKLKALPTILFFKRGKEVGRIVGAVSQDDVCREIKRCRLL